MKAILLREIKSFFGSPIGYLVIAIFLLLNGLFLWVFEGDYNILNSGFADLSPFFTIAPWILIFLIPAVTMRLCVFNCDGFDTHINLRLCHFKFGHARRQHRFGQHYGFLCWIAFFSSRLCCHWGVYFYPF